MAVTQAIAEKQKAIGVDRQAIANRQARLEEELRKIAKGRRAADLRVIAERLPAIADDLQAIAEERSRDFTVRISTFVEQRLPLGFLGLECLQMGSMTIAHLHEIHFVLTEI